MHIQKLILIPLAILGMLSIFLPWLVSPGAPAIDGTAGAGWICFGIYLVILLVIFAGNLKNRLSAFSFTCISALSLLCSVYGIILSNQQSTGAISERAQILNSTGIGLYILIIAGFLIPVIGILIRGKIKLPDNKENVQINITVVEDKKSPE